MAGKKKKSKDHQTGAASCYEDDGDKGAEAVRGVAAATHAAPIMECEICSEKFDTEGRKPRNLQCGHSFCTACCMELGRQQQFIICPKCRQKTRAGVTVEDLPVNYPVLDIITSGSEDAAASQTKRLDPQTSPHGGRCLEARAKIAMYCAYCHMWLCKDCSLVDHRRPECLLKPFLDTQKEMRETSMAKVKSTQNSLKEFSREAKAYDDKLKSFASLMMLAHDCAKKEQEHLAGIRNHSQKMEHEIRDLGEKSLPAELEEALFFFDGMEEATSAMQKWAADASAFLKGDQVFKLSKALLQTAVQMHLNHTTHASAEVVALHNIKGVDVTLPVEMDRGRLLVHAAAAHNNGLPDTGCRVVKFEHIRSCIDPSRALTFLEISQCGQNLGRVFIRLLGCTKRSQSFLMMCTGEAGPSFLNTCFHRIWWLNLPGEHVWTGDHDRGVGSGGTLPAEILLETMTLPEKKTNVAVTEGLVAGRYGKTNSTIFRIYTKSSDAIEEAAFGRVEYGFHILKDALDARKNITDITISGCGVVVEP